MTIDFLSIGHITHDIAPEGFRFGGTVSFAAATVRRLGLRPGIMTRGSTENLRIGRKQRSGGHFMTSVTGPLAGIPVCLLPSPVCTTFVNIYRGGQRAQVIEAIADPVTADALPAEWMNPDIVLLGPIAHEVESTWVDTFPEALLGVTPQGWLRTWDDAGHVRPTRWEAPEPFLRRADAVILSREDVGGNDTYLAELAGQTRLLVVTDGWHGAVVHVAGERYHVQPRPAVEVDPTGAGDVFAAAFLLRLAETRDPVQAARFANVVASMSIEAPGMEGIPERGRVEAWLKDAS